MKDKDSLQELCDDILASGLVERYDFIDVSYHQARRNELNKGYIHKQMSGNITPTIKTKITNYVVVV